MLSPNDRYRRLVDSLRDHISLDAADVRNVLTQTHRSVANLLADVLAGAISEPGYGTCERCGKPFRFRSSRPQDDWRRVVYLKCGCMNGDRHKLTTKIVCIAQQNLPTDSN